MFDFPQSAVVRIRGADAATIINNLTTNDIKRLAPGKNCQSFVTNVRGWCMALGYVCKLHQEVVLLVQSDNPASLCQHIDKYIVREDAKVEDQSLSHDVVLLNPAEAAVLAGIANPKKISADTQGHPLLVDCDEFTRGDMFHVTIADQSVLAAAIDLLHPGDVALIFENSNRHAIVDTLADAGIELESAEAFEQARIAAFWPIPGREILEKSIPQELDRDNQAISFTKGCYLGQETIARLDAIGQLQKKLCLLQIDAGVDIGRLDVYPWSDSATSAEATSIGTVTSIRPIGHCHASNSAPIATEPRSGTLALAYLRRGHFAAGTKVLVGSSPATVIRFAPQP